MNGGPAPADAADPARTDREAGRPAPGPRAHTAFALSGAVLGATNTGVNFFILIYYDQVLHLAPALAGLALALALIVDGVADPLVGWLSDRWRSSQGRRHPFLYASVVPMALSYWAIWYPPFGPHQQGALFGYLLVTTVALRLSITLFDVPSNALIPELTQDYETRTAFAAAKTSLNWTTANLVGIVSYAVWLKDDPALGAGSGMLRRAGYEHGAIWIGGLTLLAAAAVPLLLRPWVPWLRRLPPPPAAPSPAKLFGELLQTYSNGSILALLLSAVFFAAGMGLTQALWVYFLSFFWNLGSASVNAIQGAYLAAALFAWWALPKISAGRDKRKLAVTLSIVFWLNDVAPIALRLVGLMPANGSPALVPMLMVFGFLDGLLINMVLALVLSMLTDVVEDNLIKTGRREEGVVLAGQTLVTKASTALGTLLGSLVLSLVRFPQGTAAGHIGLDVVFRLGAWFVPAMWLLGLASTISLSRYGISRAEHERAVERLNETPA